MLSTTDADLPTSAMSYFGQGWESRRAQPPRWQEGRENEDEGYGGMDCGAARRRGSRMQVHGGGYKPPLAGGRGGGGGFAERQQQKQEREQAWNQGQDTRGGDVWSRGHQAQMGHREERQSGGRGGGGQHATFGIGWHADPMQRNKMMHTAIYS